MKPARRTFLRGSGVALELLDVMSRHDAADAPMVKRRMVCINTPLGMCWSLCRLNSNEETCGGSVRRPAATAY